MSRLRLTIDPRARDQIQQCHDWWAEHRSSEQAGRWLRGIEKAINGLTADPHRYALAPESESFPEEIRQLLFGLGRRPSHRVLYTIRPDCVYILSVRHVSPEPLGPDDLP